MKRSRPASTVGSVLLLTVALVLTGSNSSSGQEPSDALSTCVASNRSLSALFLVDTSLSLQRNDPENERVQAIRSALSALSALDSSTQVTVHVAFLDFSEKTRRSFPESPEWIPIPNSPAEHAAIANQFAERNEGGATDYVAALEPWVNLELQPSDEVGALETLERAPNGSCRLLVWFTDGQLDVGYHDKTLTVNWTDPPTIVNSQSVADAVWMKAEARLCSPGGLADRLRAGTDISSGSSAQVSVVALDRLGTLDFGLLRAFATGEGQDTGCGLATARGTFGTAEDIGSLAIGLRSAVLGEAHGEPEGARSCLTSEEPCEDVDADIEEYDYTFYLYPGFQRFNLLTLSSHPSVRTEIIMPSGVSFELESDLRVMEGEGVKLTSQELELKDGAYLVDGELNPGGSWVGHWRVRYTTDDPQAAEDLNRASIYVFGSLMMELDLSQAPLQAGLLNDVVFRIVGSSSEPAAFAELQSETQLQVWVNEEATSEPVMRSDGRYSVSYSVPSDFADDIAVVTGSLKPFIKLSSDAPVIPLTPWTGVLGELVVEPIGDYPLINKPGPFDGKLSDENRRLEATLFIDASRARTGGCIDVLEVEPPSIDSHALDLKILTGDRPVGVADSCPLALTDGQTASLTVVVDAAALELVEGQITAGMLKLRASNPIDPSKYRDYSYAVEVLVEPPVAVETEVEPVVTTTPQSTTTTIKPEELVVTETDTVKALLLSLIPVLFLIAALYGVKGSASRLIVGRLASVSFPIAISSGTMRRLDDGGNEVPLTIEGRDIDAQPLGGGEARARSLVLGEMTVRAKSPVLPWSKFRAVATARDATLVVGSLGTSDDGKKGFLATSLSGEWLFHTRELLERDEAGASLDPIIGTLTMAIPFEADASFANAQLREQAEAIGEQITSAAEAVADAGAETTGKESTDAADPDGEMIDDDDLTGDDEGVADKESRIFDYDDEDDW